MATLVDFRCEWIHAFTGAVVQFGGPRFKWCLGQSEKSASVYALGHHAGLDVVGFRFSDHRPVRPVDGVFGFDIMLPLTGIVDQWRKAPMPHVVAMENVGWFNAALQWRRMNHGLSRQQATAYCREALGITSTADTTCLEESTMSLDRLERLVRLRSEFVTTAFANGVVAFFSAEGWSAARRLEALIDAELTQEQARYLPPVPTPPTPIASPGEHPPEAPPLPPIDPPPQEEPKPEHPDEYAILILSETELDGHPDVERARRENERSPEDRRVADEIRRERQRQQEERERQQRAEQP